MIQSEPNPGPMRLNASAAPSSAPAILEARNLKKTYGSGAQSLPILIDANLILQRGEMVAIVAPSGAGKSTLLHLLAALDTPTSGAVYFASKAIESNQDTAVADFRNRSVGFLWQRHQLLPDFTAAENVAMPLLLRGENFPSTLATARKWLAEVGLSNRADHRAGELSGGEQQRVAIARAIITDPKILLADEPTGNLDTKNSEIVLEMLRRLNKDLGQTIVMITHNPEATTYFDRVVHMRDGVIVDGIPAD